MSENTSVHPLWLTIGIGLILAIVEGFLLTAGQTHG